MYKRLNDLSFVIGIFFTSISLILLIGHFFSSQLSASINLYTGIIFFVFGIAMTFARAKGQKESDSE